MKQSVSAPVAIVIAVVVVGAIGLFLWRHFLGSGTEAGTATAQRPTMGRPMTREQGMKMYPGHP